MLHNIDFFSIKEPIRDVKMGFKVICNITIFKFPSLSLSLFHSLYFCFNLKEAFNMSDNQTSTVKDQVAPTEPSVEAVVDNLQVSTPADESAKEVTKEEHHGDDGDSETSSDDDGEARKELGLVISALQSTVKQNQENEILIEKKVESTGEGEEELHSGDDIDSETKSITDDNTSVATSASTTVSHEEDKIAQEGNKIVQEEDTIVHEEDKIGQNEKPIEEEKVDVVEEKSVDDENKIPTESESTTIPQTFQEIVQDILPPTPGVAPQRHNFELSGRASEEVGDVESYSANLIALNKIDTKDIKPNTLSPRQQERAGKCAIFKIYYGSEILSIWEK